MKYCEFKLKNNLRHVPTCAWCDYSKPHTIDGDIFFSCSHINEDTMLSFDSVCDLFELVKLTPKQKETTNAKMSKV